MEHDDAMINAYVICNGRFHKLSEKPFTGEIVR